jgi:hypothetical protein
LWQESIEVSQKQWDTFHQQNQNQIVEVFEKLFVPGLVEHAKSLAESSRATGDHLELQCDRFAQSLEEAQASVGHASESAVSRLAEGIEESLQPALRDHATALGESAQSIVNQIESKWQETQQQTSGHADTLAAHQETLISHYAALTKTHQQAESITAMQQTLDANLVRLAEANEAVGRSVSTSAGDGMADAMRILARAVDVLTVRLAEQTAVSESNMNVKSTRRAA